MSARLVAYRISASYWRAVFTSILDPRVGLPLPYNYSRMFFPDEASLQDEHRTAASIPGLQVRRGDEEEVGEQ